MDYFGIILGITLVAMYLVFRVSEDEQDEVRRIESTLFDNRKSRRIMMDRILAVVKQRGFFDPADPYLQKLKRRHDLMCDD
jgi:hypothetical protein